MGEVVESLIKAAALRYLTTDGPITSEYREFRRLVTWRELKWALQQNEG